MANPSSDRPNTTAPNHEASAWNPAVINLQALQIYRPQIYPGRITLFRAQGQEERAERRDRDKGWSRWAAGGLEIIEVPGDHLTMLQEPHVQVLAERLNTCLERAQTKAGLEEAVEEQPEALRPSQPAQRPVRSRRPGGGSGRR